MIINSLELIWTFLVAIICLIIGIVFDNFTLLLLGIVIELLIIFPVFWVVIKEKQK